MRRFVLPLSILVALLGLRLPFLLLDELGRDEAAYLYWSYEPRWAFAPLLQLLLRVARELPLPLTFATRMVPLLATLAALFALDRWWKARGVDTRERLVAGLVLAVSPWSVHSGSLVHPDPLLLAATLATAWCAERRWWLRMGLAAAMAVWAKPTGIVVAGVALVWLLSRGTRGPSFAAALLVAVCAPVVGAFDRSILDGLLEFARVGGDSSALRPLWILATTALILGGPALFIGGIRGLVEKVRAGALDFALLAGGALLALFVAASLVTGQAKGNWILPGFVLLWSPTWPRGRARSASLIVAGVISLAIGIGFTRPELVARIESSIGAPAYLGVAGLREGRVGSANLWSQRLGEFEGMDAFAAEVTTLVGAHWPDSIVSDDYGIAAQLAIRCPSRPPRLVLPLDPVFASGAVTADAWILAVRIPARQLVDPKVDIEVVATLAHPVTAAPVTLARVIQHPEVLSP